METFWFILFFAFVLWIIVYRIAGASINAAAEKIKSPGMKSFVKGFLKVSFVISFVAIIVNWVVNIVGMFNRNK